MKKNNLRKLLSLVCAVMLCICMMNTYVYAADLDTPEPGVDIEEYSTGGVISYNTIDEDVYIPTSGYYTVTISVNCINGWGGVWVTLVDSSWNTYKVDQNVYSSFQTHVYLTAGTWKLRINAATGTYSYGIYIN